MKKRRTYIYPKTEIVILSVPLMQEGMMIAGSGLQECAMAPEFRISAL